MFEGLVEEYLKSVPVDLQKFILEQQGLKKSLEIQGKLIDRFSSEVEKKSEQVNQFRRQEAQKKSTSSRKQRNKSSTQSTETVTEQQPPVRTETKNEILLKKLTKKTEVITAQRKFTQGRQELELGLREAEYLLETIKQAELKSDGLDSTSETPNFEEAKKKLLEHVAKAKEDLKQLAAEQLVARKKKVDEVTTGLKLPDDEKSLDKKKDTVVALALQQKSMLDLEVNSAKFEQASKLVGGEDLKLLGAEFQKWNDTVSISRRLAATYELKQLQVNCEELLESTQQCVSALQSCDGDVEKFREKALKLQDLRAEVSKISGDVQAAVEKQHTADTKKSEVDAQNNAADTAVFKNLSTKPLETETMQGESENSTDLEKSKKIQKDKQLDSILRDIASQSTSLKEVQQKVAEHNQVSDLTERLGYLKNVELNNVVQGYFLVVKGGPKEKDKLAIGSSDTKSTDGAQDKAFFEMTQSAQGDYSDPANIGKYTYHVSALANILRKTGAGISVTGLNPSQGGLDGGSCEIADEEETVIEGVNIKEASIVNSRNKVAVSSNRNDGMRVYVGQREDKVAESMQNANKDKPGEGQHDQHAAKAAQDTAIMLRFPIRAQYLGKFDKDPIHLTDNLELLDGTPVPPDDIEMLAHREWVCITDKTFQETYQAMFADMLK
jgi:hypothetical protein